MLTVGQVLRMGRDLVAYIARSGQWWFGVLLIALLLVSAFVGAAHAAVPTVVYALF